MCNGFPCLPAYVFGSLFGLHRPFAGDFVFALCHIWLLFVLLVVAALSVDA